MHCREGEEVHTFLDNLKELRVKCEATQRRAEAALRDALAVLVTIRRGGRVRRRRKKSRGRGSLGKKTTKGDNRWRYFEFPRLAMDPITPPTEAGKNSESRKKKMKAKR